MTASCSWKVQSGCSGCNGMAGMAVAASRQRPPCISFTCAVAGTLVEPHRARVRPAQRPRNRVPILGCAIRVIDAKTKAGSRKVRAKPAPHAHAARARSRPSRSQEYFCPRMNGWKRPGRQMRVTHRGHAMPCHRRMDRKQSAAEWVVVRDTDTPRACGSVAHTYGSYLRKSASLRSFEKRNITAQWRSVDAAGCCWAPSFSSIARAVSHRS